MPSLLHQMQAACTSATCSHSFVPWPGADDSGNICNHSMCQTSAYCACWACRVLYIMSKDSHHLVLCMFIAALP